MNHNNIILLDKARQWKPKREHELTKIQAASQIKMKNVRGILYPIIYQVKGYAINYQVNQRSLIKCIEGRRELVLFYTLDNRDQYEKYPIQVTDISVVDKLHSNKNDICLILRRHSSLNEYNAYLDCIEDLSNAYPSTVAVDGYIFTLLTLLGNKNKNLIKYHAYNRKTESNKVIYNPESIVVINSFGQEIDPVLFE